MSSSSSSSSSLPNYEEMTTKDLRLHLTLRGVDCSNMIERQELIETAKRADTTTDYDEAGRKLLQRLNLAGKDQSTDNSSRYSNLDAIWKDPSTDAVVYVGNYQAASNKRTLKERNITAIVNCQEETSKNYFEDDPSFTYKRFLVSRLAFRTTQPTITKTTATAAMPYSDGFRDVFLFIQDQLDHGQSVLVHCLAGAHRAGTTGVAWLMYQTNSTVDDALHLAKTCRPIIRPFGALLECLHVLEVELKTSTTEIKNESQQPTDK